MYFDQPYNIRTGIGGCIFCGKEIKHLNDGGTGSVLQAALSGGVVLEYIYCDSRPICAEEYRYIHLVRHCYNPAHSDAGRIAVGDKGEGWKLQDEGPEDGILAIGDYLEFWGDNCPECGGQVRHVDARLYDPSWEDFYRIDRDQFFVYEEP